MTPISSSGDPELDERIRSLVSELPPADARIALETILTAIRLLRDDVTRLDRKIVNSALKEMRHAFRVFAAYRDFRKVSIFGSARVGEGDSSYETASEFARQIAAKGWMVITGAGPGIMQAGHEGAGLERSFGANIRLPFEGPNPIIAEDPKLINFKYFFTRKVTFIKEAHAFVLLPGGFGTLDEAFELLTLVQTGKSDLHPIVLLDHSGGDYWEFFEGFLRSELLERGYIGPDDLTLYRRAPTPEDAVAEIEQFYRIFHSQRVVARRLIFRLNLEPSPEELVEISHEFSDILDAPLERARTSKEEIRDDDVPELPRILVPFGQAPIGRLRTLVDRLNQIGS